MTMLSSHANFTSPRSFRSGLVFASLWRLMGAAETVARWWRTIDERRMLASLDDRALQDFGATRAEAIREAEKPFWR